LFARPTASTRSSASTSFFEKFYYNIYWFSHPVFLYSGDRHRADAQFS
jgi:hypothetical protein